jgi:predicted RNase H-like nuclease (RuvC/YqgF family)
MKVNVMKLFRDLMKLGKVETDNGVLIYEGDVLTEGTEVFIEDESGNIIPAPDGQYGDYKVVDGKIAPSDPVEEPVEEPVAESVEQSEEPATEPEPESEPEEDKYEKRFEALEKEIEDLKAALAELQKEKEDMEFSALKPAEKEIKDLAAKNVSKGALKYFE